MKRVSCDRLLLWLLTLMLCLGSLSCSVLLFYSLPAGGFMALMFGGFAVALEGCKYVFWPMGWYLIRNGRSFQGLALQLLALVLVCVSVMASIGFMESGATAGDASQAKQSDVYMALERKLLRLEARMQARNALALKGLEVNFITRGGANLDSADALEAEWQATQQELKALATVKATGAYALLAPVATGAGLSVAQLRYGFFISMAVLVELCAVALLWWLALPAPVAKGVQTSLKPADKPLQTVDATVALSKKALQVVAMVRDGAEPVVKRFTQSPVSIRHNHVKAAFDYLLTHGDIMRDGQGFRRV